MNTARNGTLDWPDDVDAVVVSPLNELKSLAARLEQRTNGQLIATVKTLESSEGTVSHQLDLVLPSRLLRRRLLIALHNRDDLYPVTVEASCFDPDDEPDPGWHYPSAATYNEFKDLLQHVLSSDQTRSAIHSLKAQAQQSN